VCFCCRRAHLEQAKTREGSHKKTEGGNNMYAIVETGAKQYKVSKGDVLRIEKLNLKTGKEVKLGKVLFISDKSEISIGKPYIKGASIMCEVLDEVRAKKVISFKYRRRLGNSRKKIGHRQTYSVVKVKEIEVK